MDASEKEWLEAVVPDVTVCLGTRLRPFSLGAWKLLKRLESPFVRPGVMPSKSDLLEAVFVCSRKFEEAYYGTNDPARKWAYFFGTAFMSRCRFLRACAIMQQHIDNGLNWPRLGPKQNNSDGHECQSPFLQVLLVHSLTKLNQRREDVLDQPLALTYWLYATAAEMTGQASLCTRAMSEELAAARAAGDAAEARNNGKAH